MPVVLSAELGGWVRVPAKRSPPSAQKQAEALRTGALSYFACMPPPPPKTSKLPTFPNAPGPPRSHYSVSRADPDEYLAEEDEEAQDDGDFNNYHNSGRHHQPADCGARSDRPEQVLDRAQQ
ncbi:hypothetical protein DV735_g4222, partial [Chaetothyriales sp. CBS 134920]